MSYLDEDSYIYNNDLITIAGNLLENSFEAVEKKGENEKEVYFFIKHEENTINISVADTGTGIEKSVINRIFERGYTTKNNSNGVGLDIVKKSVNNMNGNIDISSEPGKGTEINISLQTGGSN